MRFDMFFQFGYGSSLKGTIIPFAFYLAQFGHFLTPFLDSVFLCMPLDMPIILHWFSKDFIAPFTTFPLAHKITFW
eukprot:01457.XXX_827_1054_1 [CDS] Oithona nana genome sequencing.